MRRRISSGSVYEERAGYSRAVVDGDWIFVAGTTGFDYASNRISDDLAEQTEQCFRNIAAALAEADASIDDVVRATYYLTNDSFFEPCAPIFGKWFKTARPAATAIIVAGLVDPRMKIEIEVTARRRGSVG